MHMRDWLAKLDDFLRISEREILTHAGRVSRELAAAKAEAEYDKYRRVLDMQPSPVEGHFEEAVRKIKQLSKGKKNPE